MSTVSNTITLNGSSQGLTAADSVSLSPTGDQTHEGWVTITTLPSSGAGVIIFSKYSGASRGISMSYENSGGTLRFHARVSASGGLPNEGTLNYTIQPGFHFLRFVYTAAAGTIDIYVDNIATKVGTISSMGTVVNDSSALYQLGFNTDIDGFLTGSFGFWRVWGAVHTTYDKFTIYGSAQTNLKAEWSLDNVLTDASGNSNTLTNVASATFGTNLPGGLDGGIGFDNYAIVLSNVTNNQSGSFTVTGANPTIIGWARDNGSATTTSVTGMTYNGVSMTQVTGSPFNWTSGGSIAIFILAGAATGSNTFAVTTGGARSYDAGCISYINTKQSGQPDAQRTHSFTGTSLSEAITTVADRSWAVMMLDNGVSPPITTSGSNFAMRGSQDGEGLGDSNGYKTPAGSFTQSATLSPSTNHGAFQISIAPFVAAITRYSNFLAF